MSEPRGQLSKKDKQAIGVAAVVGIAVWLFSKQSNAGCSCQYGGTSTGTYIGNTGWGTGTFPASGTQRAL